MSGEYILDDVLELPGGDVFCAMSIDDGGQIYGPPTYVRVSRETFDDYEAFRTLLMRDAGIAFTYPPADEADGDERQKVWSTHVACHLDTAGTSATAWQTAMTVGA